MNKKKSDAIYAIGLEKRKSIVKVYKSRQISFYGTRYRLTLN